MPSMTARQNEIATIAKLIRLLGIIVQDLITVTGLQNGDNPSDVYIHFAMDPNAFTFSKSLDLVKCSISFVGVSSSDH